MTPRDFNAPGVYDAHKAEMREKMAKSHFPRFREWVRDNRDELKAMRFEAVMSGDKPSDTE